MSARPELLIFDWDGTLMDSAGELVGMLQQAIQDIGLPERTPAQMRELVGLGLQDVLARLFPERDPAHLMDRLRRYRDFYRWTPSRSRLFPGAREALDSLRARGHVLAVATGKSRRGLDRALAEHDCAALFRVTRCADESAPKPAPAMIADILLRTATAPEDALMIGDTEYDVAMALSAGVAALGVRCGVHEERRLRRAGACDVIDGVDALPDWLDGGGAPGPGSGQGDPRLGE